jgi:hypothetical protein
MSGQDVPNFAVAPTSSCGDLTEDWLDLDALFEGKSHQMHQTPTARCTNTRCFQQENFSQRTLDMMLYLMEPRLESRCQAVPYNNPQSLAHNYVMRSEKRAIGRRTPALSLSRTRMSLREGKVLSIYIFVDADHLSPFQTEIGIENTRSSRASASACCWTPYRTN